VLLGRQKRERGKPVPPPRSRVMARWQAIREESCRWSG
jgi:hypothetical protein